MQKKLPFINSAHGSETRNIINELIKLFNDMGYTYNEALQKAHDVLEEAQRKSNDILYEAERVNAMNESVQQQINTIIAESGTSDAEVLQARIDLKGNTHSVLKERIDSTDYKIDDISINVRNFGAVGDGSTNDRAAFLAAKEEAIRLVAELYIPSGDFYIDGDLDLTGVRFIKAIGNITFADSTNKLTIAHDSSKTTSKVYRIGDVFVGYVELLGMKNAEFHIAYTRHLKLFADGNTPKINSIAYNSFYPGRIDLLEYDSLNSGWINENKWFGGRIVKVLIDGHYNHNHNIFYGPTMERTGKPAEIILNKGSSNRFLNVRWEGPSEENKVVFGSDTYDNTVERSWTGAPDGYMQGSYRISNVADNGVGNSVLNDMDKHHIFKKIYGVSKNEANFNTNWSEITSNDLSILFDGVYEPFFETGIFEVEGDFSLKFISDSPLWRMRLYMYDENKTLITNESMANEAVSSFTMNWDGSKFSTAIPRNESSFNFKRTTGIKYIEITVAPESQGVFNSLEIFIRKSNSDTLTIPTKKGLDVLRGGSPPNSNDFMDGIICWNTSDSDGSVIGWKKSSGGWKSFGALNIHEKYNAGTFIDNGTGAKNFWTIPHGLGEIPKRFGVTPGNSDTGDMRVKYVNPTGSNLVVFLSGSVPIGEGNVQIHWWVEA